jgi:hypothetical protein
MSRAIMSFDTFAIVVLTIATCFGDVLQQRMGSWMFVIPAMLLGLSITQTACRVDQDVAWTLAVFTVLAYDTMDRGNGSLFAMPLQRASETAR